MNQMNQAGQTEDRAFNLAEELSEQLMSASNLRDRLDTLLVEVRGTHLQAVSSVSEKKAAQPTVQHRARTLTELLNDSHKRMLELESLLCDRVPTPSIR
jgi:hypothetical protein